MGRLVWLGLDDISLKDGKVLASLPVPIVARLKIMGLDFEMLNH